MLLIVWVAFVSLLVSVRNHIVLFLKSLKADNNLSLTVKQLSDVMTGEINFPADLTEKCVHIE